MQSSRGSLDEAFLEALYEARSASKPVIEGEAIIAASPGAEAPARVLHLGVLHSGARSVYLRPSEAALHFMPYRDFKATLVVFTLESKDTRALHAVEAAVNLGVKSYVVSPGMHPAYEQRLEELGAEHIKMRRYPLLSMTLAALTWAPRMQGFREQRLREEIEALDTALEWVRDRYFKEIEEARALASSAGFTAYHTPTGAPGAFYLARVSRVREAPLEVAPQLRAPGVAFTASIEEPSYRDVVLSARVRGARIVVVQFNTDPVSAGVYSVIAAALIAGEPA